MIITINISVPHPVQLVRGDSLYVCRMNRHARRKQKAKTHKAQHFVAQGYTRAWCDPNKADHEEPYVWVFDRNGPTADSPGKRKAPVNIFKEPEMYTISPANNPQVRDLSLEHGLGKIESEFCSVRRDYVHVCRPLGPQQRGILLAFAACSQFRTPGFRDHTRSQWKPILDMGREMEERMRSATTEQKKRMARGSLGAGRSESMTMEQVQAIVDKPLQTTLASHVRVAADLLARMTHMTILCTSQTPGFITSDEPVAWFDPEAYKRPPMFRGPALMYETIEITMPISPTRMLFLGRQNTHWPEYMDLDALDLNERLLNDLNRRTCRHAREKVVVSRNEFRQIWTDPGVPAADAWQSDDGDSDDPETA